MAAAISSSFSGGKNKILPAYGGRSSATEPMFDNHRPLPRRINEQLISEVYAWSCDSVFLVLSYTPLKALESPSTSTTMSLTKLVPGPHSQIRC